MLTLTRRIGETIHIGDHIRITVADIVTAETVLHIEAPPCTTLTLCDDVQGIHSTTSLRAGRCRIAMTSDSCLQVAGVDVSVRPWKRSRRQVAVDLHAPRDIPIHRAEIYARIQAQRAA